MSGQLGQGGNIGSQPDPEARKRPVQSGSALVSGRIAASGQGEDFGLPQERERRFETAPGSASGSATVSGSPNGQGGTFLRFLLVGGSFAGLYAGACTLLTALLPLPAAGVSVLVWLALIPPAYACQRRFAFRASQPRRGALLFYAMTQGVGLVIASTIAALFAGQEPGRNLVVFLAGSALAAVASYLLNRMITFAGPSGAAAGSGERS